jgi:hypothetical protein
VALSIDELLTVDDRPITSVRIAEWNADVLVRAMNGVELYAFDLFRDKKPAPSAAELRKALFLRSFCDADGNRLKPDVIDKVMAKSGVALEQLWEALVDLNGLSAEAREKKLGKPEGNSNEETSSSG